MAGKRNHAGLFKPGQSGNPKGRPKKPFCIAETLRSIGNEKLPPDWRTMLKEHGVASAGMTKLQAVMHVVYIQAIQGESWATHFIAERTEGKVPDKIEMAQTDDLTQLSDAELEAIAAGG